MVQLPAHAKRGWSACEANILCCVPVDGTVVSLVMAMHVLRRVLGVHPCE